MTRVNPQEATSKWVTRLSAATSDIQAGIAKVTTPPGQKAAQSFQKYQNNVQAAFPKWKNNVAAVSLSSWQQAATAGVQRVAQGAQQKQSKYQDFAQQFFPVLDANVAKVQAMPNATFEDRVQRAVQMMRLNSNFKRQPSA
jgi:hypothetical protein